MRWQYRTIIFEFAKDGLLGERYINDEEMEAALNKQGEKGWELVNVVMIQEGLLAVLKKEENKRAEKQDVWKAQPAEETPQITENERVSVEQIRQQEIGHIKKLEQGRRKRMQENNNDQIGSIRIN